LDRSAPRRTAWIAGLAAGLVLACADWAASGLRATPAILVAATLIAGLLAGGLAGALAAAWGRPAFALAQVLAGGIALEGLSIASKELVGPQRVLGALLVGVVALATLLVCMRTPPGRAQPALVAPLGALALLPAAAWLAARLSDEPWIRLAATAAPLLWILASARASARGPRAGLAWLGLLAILAAAQFESDGPPRIGPPPPPPGPSSAERPSIVLLVIDTLRADAVAPTGALAAFAREGVEFRQCVSTAPWTLPAVGSLLTGLYPSQHGAVTAATPLDEEVTTLAEILAASGYATAAFTGGAFVGPAHRLDQGFQVFDARRERRFATFRTHVPLVWRLAKNRYLPLRALVRAADESVGLAGVLEGAREWAKGEPHRPKFLLLHTYQVHDYYLYDPDLDDPVLAARPPPSAAFVGRLSVHPAELTRAAQDDLEHFRALYLGRVAAVERLFPALVAALTPHVGADALWVVTADHGEGFDAAAGRVHHGGRLHEDLLRVPLFLRAPGRLAPGQVVDASVRSIDVLPTLLDLVGLAVPAGLAGESLLPALRGERPFPASAFAEERAHGAELLALRRDGWKWTKGGRYAALHHLSEDPGEQEPVAGAPPAALAQEFATFPTRYPARVRAEVELDADTFEHLRSLGYVH
jgi:arylsulfatase A-like enzyme